VPFLIAIYHVYATVIVMAVYDSLTVTVRQSEMDSRIDECLAQSQVSDVGSLSSYVNTEGLVGLFFFVSHYLFMQSISIPSLVGNFTIVVVFFVVSENQNVITNSLNVGQTHRALNNTFGLARF
jgi:hypothetical protein